MVSSFAVLEKAETVVFETITLNLAAAVCNQLEDAGFPAQLGKADSGFAVRVPPEYAQQSRSLLMAAPQTGEILFSVA